MKHPLVTPHNDTSFQDFLAAREPEDLTLVAFIAPWCGPSSLLCETLDSLPESILGRVWIVKADIDKCPEAPQQMGVRATPTLAFLKGSSVRTMSVGKMPEGELEETLREFIKASSVENN